MAHKAFAFALGVAVAAPVPASATITEPTPATGAPEAGPEAKYCMRIEAVTGTRLEKVKCWTRQEWADQDVDVDAEWAEEGVTVIA